MVDSSIARTGTKLVKERPFTGKIKRCETWHYIGSGTANMRRCAQDAEVEMTIKQTDGQMKRMYRCSECAAKLREAVTGNVTSEAAETAVSPVNHRIRPEPYWKQMAGKATTAEDLEREERLGQYRSASNLRSAVGQQARERNALVNQSLSAQRRALTADEINKELFG